MLYRSLNYDRKDKFMCAKFIIIASRIQALLFIKEDAIQSEPASATTRELSTHIYIL